MMKPKQLIGKYKKWNIIGKNDLGFIEDVYGNGISFNVYRSIGKQLKPSFYKSCYNMDTAYKLLNELKNVNNEKS